MDGVGAGANVPHPGEQFVFATDSSQLTPWSLPSPVTCAVIVTADAPAPIKAKVLLRETTTGAAVFGLPDPHEVNPIIVAIVKTANAIRFMTSLMIEWGRSSFWI